MRGKALTKATDDLSLIFFKIRTTRDPKTRRSWQRRARVALAKLDFLTDAERHEIACVWSHKDGIYIDSPALRKLLKMPKLESQTRPAKAYTRRRFDLDAQTTGAKKPAISGLSVPAANDAIYDLSRSTFSRTHRDEPYRRQRLLSCNCRGVAFPAVFPHSLECTFQRFRRGSDERPFFRDSRVRQPRRRERKLDPRRPTAAKAQRSFFSFSTFKSLARMNN